MKKQKDKSSLWTRLIKEFTGNEHACTRSRLPSNVPPLLTEDCSPQAVDVTRIQSNTSRSPSWLCDLGTEIRVPKDADILQEQSKKDCSQRLHGKKESFRLGQSQERRYSSSLKRKVGNSSNTSGNTARVGERAGLLAPHRNHNTVASTGSSVSRASFRFRPNHHAELIQREDKPALSQRLQAQQEQQTVTGGEKERPVNGVSTRDESVTSGHVGQSQETLCSNTPPHRAPTPPEELHPSRDWLDNSVGTLAAPILMKTTTRDKTSSTKTTDISLCNITIDACTTESPCNNKMHDGSRRSSSNVHRVLTHDDAPSYAFRLLHDRDTSHGSSLPHTSEALTPRTRVPTMVSSSRTTPHICESTCHLSSPDFSDTSSRTFHHAHPDEMNKSTIYSGRAKSLLFHVPLLTMETAKECTTHDNVHNTHVVKGDVVRRAVEDNADWSPWPSPTPACFPRIAKQTPDLPLDMNERSRNRAAELGKPSIINSKEQAGQPDRGFVSPLMRTLKKRDVRRATECTSARQTSNDHSGKIIAAGKSTERCLCHTTFVPVTTRHATGSPSNQCPLPGRGLDPHYSPRRRMPSTSLPALTAQEDVSWCTSSALRRKKLAQTPPPSYQHSGWRENENSMNSVSTAPDAPTRNNELSHTSDDPRYSFHTLSTAANCRQRARLAFSSPSCSSRVTTSTDRRTTSTQSETGATAPKAELSEFSVSLRSMHEPCQVNKHSDKLKTAMVDRLLCIVHRMADKMCEEEWIDYADASHSGEVRAVRCAACDEHDHGPSFCVPPAREGILRSRSITLATQTAHKSTNCVDVGIPAHGAQNGNEEAQAEKACKNHANTNCATTRHYRKMSGGGWEKITDVGEDAGAKTRQPGMSDSDVVLSSRSQTASAIFTPLTIAGEVAADSHRSAWPVRARRHVTIPDTFVNGGGQPGESQMMRDVTEVRALATSVRSLSSSCSFISHAAAAASAARSLAEPLNSASTRPHSTNVGNILGAKNLTSARTKTDQNSSSSSICRGGATLCRCSSSNSRLSSDCDTAQSAEHTQTLCCGTSDLPHDSTSIAKYTLANVLPAADVAVCQSFRCMTKMCLDNTMCNRAAAQARVNDTVDDEVSFVRKNKLAGPPTRLHTNIFDRGDVPPDQDRHTPHASTRASKLSVAATKATIANANAAKTTTTLANVTTQQALTSTLYECACTAANTFEQRERVCKLCGDGGGDSGTNKPSRAFTPKVRGNESSYTNAIVRHAAQSNACDVHVRKSEPLLLLPDHKGTPLRTAIDVDVLNMWADMNKTKECADVVGSPPHTDSILTANAHMNVGRTTTGNDMSTTAASVVSAEPNKSRNETGVTKTMNVARPDKGADDYNFFGYFLTDTSAKADHSMPLAVAAMPSSLDCPPLPNRDTSTVSATRSPVAPLVAFPPPPPPIASALHVATSDDDMTDYFCDDYYYNLISHINESIE